MERYRVLLGLIYTRVKKRVTPFEHVSRKGVLTLFQLLAKCINTRNIDISLMEENTTCSILLTLPSLEARFAIKISLLSTDAGKKPSQRKLESKIKNRKD